MWAAPRDQFVKKDRNHMDGTRFDQLIKSIATQRVTRLTALRGLAAGAVASFTGLSLFGEEGEAKDGKKTRKRKICHRGSDFTILGTTKRLKKQKARRHLRRDPADYKGACTAAKSGLTGGTTTTTGAPPNPGVQCAVDQDCAGGLVCRGGRCDFCNNNQECPGDQLCIQGQCRGGPSDFAGDCENTPEDCPFPLECIETDDGGDFFCFLPEMDYNNYDPGACAPVDDTVDPDECPELDNFGDENIDVDSVCVLGACVVLCTSEALEEACEDEGGECRAGVCYDKN
jgi:hypothetical protein